MKFRIKDDVWKEGEDLSGIDVAMMLADMFLEADRDLRRLRPDLFKDKEALKLGLPPESLKVKSQKITILCPIEAKSKDTKWKKIKWDKRGL